MLAITTPHRLSRSANRLPRFPLPLTPRRNRIRVEPLSKSNAEFDGASMATRARLGTSAAARPLVILAGLAAAFLLTRLARRYGVPLKITPTLSLPAPRAKGRGGRHAD
jgi:hypothetical protein